MKTDFKLYVRKIHVYKEQTSMPDTHARFLYCWSTYAHRTCRDAVKAAKEMYPEHNFKASFAKD
jgi:hypothetical protein